MTRLGRPRSREQWVADLHDKAARAEALQDLREYLLRAVYVYLDRHREDLSHLDRRELEQLAADFVQDALLQILDKLDTFRRLCEVWSRPVHLETIRQEEPIRFSSDGTEHSEESL